MAAGLNANLTKQTIDETIGRAAQDLNIAFGNVGAAKVFLDTAQDADLEAIGYTANDVATLRSAMADLEQLRTVYHGLAEVSPAKDFTAFARRVWGTGFIVGR
jgi:hypothetical protein